MPAESLPTNGACIRALRQAYGIKLYELAKDLDITDGHLGKIETGRVNASLTILRRITARFHVPLDAIVRCPLPDHMSETNRPKPTIAA